MRAAICGLTLSVSVVLVSSAAVLSALPGHAQESRGDLILFDADSADLPENAAAVVAKVIQDAGPTGAAIEVTGRTDTVGSEMADLKLSHQRAEAVAAALQNAGVPADKIQVLAKGKHDLIVATESDVREPRNNSVTITVLK